MTSNKERIVREIVRHKVGDCVLDIFVRDEAGPGGASHLYELEFPDGKNRDRKTGFCIRFQKGPINEVGNNGATNEALLAIVLDRLEAFQRGPCPAHENTVAITAIKRALGALQDRTRDRMRRNVLGEVKP